jgi:hypothetical protein
VIDGLEIVQYVRSRPGLNGASPACGVGRFPGSLSGRDAQVMAGLLRAFVRDEYHMVIERRETQNHDAVMKYLRGCNCSYHLQESKTRRLKLGGLLPRFGEVIEVPRMWLQLDHKSLCGFLERFWPGTLESGVSFLVLPSWVTPAIWALQNAGREGLREMNGVLYRLDQSDTEYLGVTSDESRIRIASLVEHFAVTSGLKVTYVKK